MRSHRIVIVSALACLISLPQIVLANNPCGNGAGNPATTPTITGGACTGPSWDGSEVSFSSCTLTGSTASGSPPALEMGTCSSCKALLGSTASGALQLICLGQHVVAGLEMPLASGTTPTISNTSGTVNVLNALDYHFFQYGEETDEADVVVGHTGEEITYQLGDDLYDAGFRYSGIKWLWYPGYPTVSQSPITHSLGTSSTVSTITLTDSGTAEGGYVFLFTFTNVNESGTVYLSPDPTIYNPPASLPEGGGT